MPKSLASLNFPLLSAVLVCGFSLSPNIWAEIIKTDNSDVIEQARASEFQWVARDALPDPLQERIPPGCRGAYIQVPLQTDERTDLSLDQQDLIVEADHAEVSDGSRAVLEGDVVVRQGDRAIGAQRMEYDRVNDRASLRGDVTIRQPGMHIQGQSADVSTTRHQASFDDANFVLQAQQVRGSAGSIRQTSRDELELREGKVTSCEPGDEAWVLEGEKIVVNKATQQGTGRNVKLKVAGVPVFWLPYISFPVGEQRQSGWLFPSLSSSDDGGLDIAVPYYWNLAPNYDAMLTPRFISGRGTMFEGEGRYLNRWLRTELGLAILPDDGGSEDPDLDRLIEAGEITEEEARPHRGSNRWLQQFSLNSFPTQGWFASADYTRVSDVDYFRDLGTSSLSVANLTFLDQIGEVGYQFQHWRVATRAQTQQVLLLDLDSPYRRLPQVDVNGRYTFNDWVVDLGNQYTYFRHRENRPDILTGQRVNTDYRLRLEKRAPFGFFVPEIGYKGLTYKLDDNPLFTFDDDTEFTLATPQASLDIGLIFEHPAGNFTQTLEPRVFYLYRDFRDHSTLFDLGNMPDLDINFDTSDRTFTYGQLYRDSRFIGGDRLDDADQVTLGLTSRWSDNRNGRDLFIASVGQIFYFQDRRVSLFGTRGIDEQPDSSEFAAELTINFGTRTSLYSDAVYDTESRRINRGSASLNFASEDYQHLFNIGYAYLRNLTPSAAESGRQIDQVDASFVVPINAQWSLMGRANYDIVNQQELETFFGFEYNDCCYRFRFLARRWLDSNIANLVDNEDAQYDQGVFFEIHFKGLGGSGAKVNSILRDGILGYDRRERSLH